MPRRDHLAVVPAPAVPRSAARDALAVAIQRVQDAERKLVAVVTAREAADQAVWPFHSRIEDAEASLRTASARMAEHAVAVALGKAGEPPRSRQQLEADIASLKSDQADARAVATAFDVEQKKVGSELRFAQILHDDAVIAVVREDPAMQALVERYRECKLHCLAVEHALTRLDSVQPGVWARDRFAVREEDASSALAGVWAGAVTALRTDPDTLLPSSTRPQ